MMVAILGTIVLLFVTLNWKRKIISIAPLLIVSLMQIGCATQREDGAIVRNPNNDSLTEEEPKTKIVHIAGTLRCYGFNDCSLIEDADHTPLNVTQGRSSGDWLVVDFAKAKRVISFVAGPDESLALLGVTCGASVGLDRANIKCSGQREDGTREQFRAHDIAAVPNSNIWFYGVMEYEE